MLSSTFISQLQALDIHSLRLTFSLVHFTLERNCLLIVLRQGKEKWCHSFLTNEKMLTCDYSLNRTRHGDCSDLKICYQALSQTATEIESYFPPSFLLRGSSFDINEMFKQGDCNVLATNLVVFASNDHLISGITSGQYVFGNELLSEDMLSIASRNDDAQWHDIIHGTFEGVTRGYTNSVAAQNASRCLPSQSNISFMMAPLCVGNLAEILYRHFSAYFKYIEEWSGHQLNASKVNGAIYAPRYGTLDCPTCTDAGTLHRIIQRKQLNCGVIDDPKNTGLSSMSKFYCHAVAAAIFQGDPSAVSITYIDFADNSLRDLSERGLDMVAGESRYGLKGWWSPDLSGWSADLAGRFSFSVPYYYTSLDDGQFGKDISLVTRADDVLFSSFVNAVVTATINAEEDGVTQSNSEKMPLIGLFGGELRWMLRDVIRYKGNYEEIYYETHNITNDEERGYNRLIKSG